MGFAATYWLPALQSVLACSRVPTIAIAAAAVLPYCRRRCHCRCLSQPHVKDLRSRLSEELHPSQTPRPGPEFDPIVDLVRT